MVASRSRRVHVRRRSSRGRGSSIHSNFAFQRELESLSILLPGKRDSLAEWLRRLTRNQLCSARMGSNPIAVAFAPKEKRCPTSSPSASPSSTPCVRGTPPRSPPGALSLSRCPMERPPRSPQALQPSTWPNKSSKTRRSTPSFWPPLGTTRSLTCLQD
eukprot:XP_001705099.1 Hypothetical protein GL50803_20311 [Giardia lamblia ATCC 50803]